MIITWRLDYRHGSSALSISEIIKEIKHNEDVSFYWEILASNWESEEAEELHDMLSPLYYSAWFSHAVENCKRSSKCTQKSKGIRKTLIGKSSDE